MKKTIITIICILLVILILAASWYYYSSFKRDQERTCKTFGSNYYDYISVDKINGVYKQLCCNENDVCFSFD